MFEQDRWTEEEEEGGAAAATNIFHLSHMQEMGETIAKTGQTCNICIFLAEMRKCNQKNNASSSFLSPPPPHPSLS